jgi:hypothetical protein
MHSEEEQACLKSQASVQGSFLRIGGQPGEARAPGLAGDPNRASEKEMGLGSSPKGRRSPYARGCLLGEL